MRASILTLAIVLTAAQAQAAASAADGTAMLAITSARIEISGTSNIHAFTAVTTDVMLVEADVAGADADVLARAIEPGAVAAFEVTIPAASLSSPREGIDKNMHRALKAPEHPLIRFKLGGVEPMGQHHRASGTLTIAGVEREVSFDVQIRRTDASLVVSGTTDVLMTDFGITPPKAMLGMLRTNPKVQVRLELTLAARAE